MNDEQLKGMAVKVVANLGYLKEEAKAVKSMKDAFNILPEVIRKVEEVSADVKIAGEQKKELAIYVLNRIIDVPWLPERVEAWLINMAIDAVIAALNRFLGKSWLSKIL